jgi:tetratricopeptide (TPR) repeat protein
MTTASEATSQGYQARKDGKFSMAREHYADAAKLYREQNDLLAYAHTIRHIADIYQQERNPVPVKPLYEEALEIYRSNLQTKLLDLANTVRRETGFCGNLPAQTHPPWRSRETRLDEDGSSKIVRRRFGCHLCRLCFET